MPCRRIYTSTLHGKGELMSVEPVGAYQFDDAYGVLTVEVSAASHSNELTISVFELYSMPPLVIGADSVTKMYCTAVVRLGDHRSVYSTTNERKPLSYRPKTPLGQRLWSVRERVVASGQPLLDWEDIEREIAESRRSYDELEA